ncbi:MAG: TetR/AcrR family transcriptional regulator [Inquilinus limosus]|uniref:TetR/AcrR family transcriptional regulator n=1 Tax=Inquilinus limosus TaxID=171674 RepID=A0A952FNX3_9PROT|nr:TetR/AcrR family transcriptional regulator [Inquilinus limosus]
MRYSKDHKQETRERIIRTAARRFREDGVEAVGVAALMADAGLTHGGFYAHFPSKEALVAAACAEGFGESQRRLRKTVEQRPAGERLAAMAESYLSPSHRDHPGQGCIAAAIGPEIVRHTAETRAAFTRGLRDLVDMAEAAIAADGGDPAAAPQAVATMVGALILARSASDEALSDRFLESGRQAIRALAPKAG